jgi:acetyltransferase-like isoleucine patch superfamily enzyme
MQQMTRQAAQRILQHGIFKMLRHRIGRGLNVIRGYLKTAGLNRSGRVSAERGVKIRRNAFARINLGKNVFLAQDCGIAVFGTAERPAELTIGNRTSFQPRSRINCSVGIRIGDECAFSWDVDILDTDFHTVVVAGEPVINHGEIRIEDRVWVGLGVKILKGVTIGHDSVIAAGAVVTRSIPPMSLAAGCPAVVVKSISGWKP